MRMKLYLLAGLISLAGLWTEPALHAQTVTPVDVYLKSKKGTPIKNAVITSENAQGIKVSGQGDVLPAEDIEDVIYTNRISEAKIRSGYYNAILEEEAAKEAVVKEKREEHLQKAITKYKEALAQIPADLLHPRRHAQFKMGYLTAQIGFSSDKQQPRLEAIIKLNEFKTAHPDSWQYTPAMLTLIKLYAEQKKFDDVRAAVNELSLSKVQDQVKHQAKMLLARLIMEEGKIKEQQKDAAGAAQKYGEAQKELESFLSALPKDSPLKLQAQLAHYQCKAVTGDQNDKKQVTADLEKLLKDTSDKELRPAIYNTLGELYLKDGRTHDARWQFLWVEVIYNQDKEEHARALYHLWKIFNQLNEPERGQDFFDTLTTDARFLNTHYREKAFKEAKEAP